MAKLFNLARVSTSTTGTGTVTLGAPISGYLSFASAGVANGDTVAYGISDGANSEIGTGVYSSTGPTLTRTVTNSTNSNTAVSLSGTAQVFITPRAADLMNPASNLSDVANTQTAQSNLLGTFASYTPTVTVTGGSGTSHSSEGGSYYKIGKLLYVDVFANVSWSSAPSQISWSLPAGLSLGSYASILPGGAFAQGLVGFGFSSGGTINLVPPSGASSGTQFMVSGVVLVN